MPDGRVPYSRTQAGLTTAAIADAALRLVRRDGFAGLSMRRLAAELGVRAPSLYEHVASKDDLLALVASRFVADHDVDARFDEARSLDDFLAALDRAVRQVRRFYLDHPGLAAAVLAIATPVRAPVEGPRGAPAHAEIEAMVRLGVPEEEAVRRYEANTLWFLGAIVAEDLPHPARGDDEQRFLAGLSTYLEGERVQLERLLR